MATFTYTPDWNATVNSAPRARVVRFGDGYEQRVGDGINTAVQEWNLSFAARRNSEAVTIISFLEARGAVEAFDWVPPNEVTAIKVVCRDWRRTFDRYDLNTITATFSRVYEL